VHNPTGVQVIDVDRDGPLCRITLSRPERLNALGEQMRTELHDALNALAEDTSVRVCVIAGAGRAFSAGADLRDPRPAPPDWAARRHAAGAWQRLLDTLEAIPQVTVAVLHAHVIGGAVLLAASCDLRVAATDLQLSIPEVAMGIPLTWAGLPRLVREIGLPRTRELVMTGRVVGAEEAHAWGFVHRLAEPADLQASADQLVGELLAMPAGPLALTRSALAAMGRRDLWAAWSDPDLISWSSRDPEGVKAAAAYRARLDDRRKLH
jgi:enoyl-CoA hydratase/carnithine racemase